MKSSSFMPVQSSGKETSVRARMLGLLGGHDAQSRQNIAAGRHRKEHGRSKCAWDMTFVVENGRIRAHTGGLAKKLRCRERALHDAYTRPSTTKACCERKDLNPRPSDD